MVQKFENEVRNPNIEMVEISLDCNQTLSSDRNVREFLSDIAEEFGLEILDIVIHEFDPQGITGLAIVGESHIAVHTWPEHEYVHVLVSSCKVLPSFEQIYDIFNKLGYEVIEEAG